jgi:hypothetical protein
MRDHRLFWGIVVLIVGTLLLLNNLGVLAPIDLDIGELIWPLLLIALGGWILWTSVIAPPTYETEALSVPLEGAETANVHLHQGAGVLRVQVGAEPGTLLDGTFSGGLKHRVQRAGSQADVRLSMPSDAIWMPWAPSGPREWDVHLSDQIPLSLQMKTGASDARLDLTEVQVTALSLETGASSTEVHLPAHTDLTRVNVEGGVASVRIHVPAGVAARIRSDSGLVDFHVDQNRFPRTGAHYQSPDYDEAEHKIDLHVEMGVGSVKILG